MDWDHELNPPVNHVDEHGENHVIVREVHSPSRDEQPAFSQTLEIQQCRYILGLTNNLFQLLVNSRGFRHNLSASTLANVAKLANQSSALMIEMQTGLNNGSLLPPATYRQRLTVIEREFMQLTSRD